MKTDSNQGKSFAERFAKKPAMTSENLAQKSEGEINQKNDPQESVDPLKKSKSDLIYLVKGVDDNRNAWYYVLVERLKLKLFLKALNDEIIHLENYGVILHSAYGDEPPAEITDAVKKEYGIK